VPAGHDSPPLRVLYRTWGGEGNKPRPPYYSKLLALTSLLRAAEALDNPPQLVFLNDQVRPGPLLSLMESAGEVVPVKGGSDARTYRLMLAREAERQGRPDQFLFFSEDDYLYRPDALRVLTRGVEALPDADYLALSGSSTLDLARSGAMAAEIEPRGAIGNPTTITVDGTDWFRAVAATSTFGTRLRTLREDLTRLRFCALTGGAWDTTTCKTIAGYRPFSKRELMSDLVPTSPGALPGWPRSFARGGMRLAATALSYRPHARRRKLYITDPEQILHMEVWDESGCYRPSPRTAVVDWAAVAAETVEWATERGIAVPPLVAS
jgi:hypothetical protein